jgi:hypothetical protein
LLSKIESPSSTTLFVALFPSARQRRMEDALAGAIRAFAPQHHGDRGEQIRDNGEDKG